MTGLQLLGICLCLVSVSLVHFGAGGEYPSFCTTFEDKPGWCKHFGECAYFRDLVTKIKKGLPLTEEETRIKENAGCSTKKTFVCCEEHVNGTGLELLQQSEEACGKFLRLKVLGGSEIKMGSRPWMALLKYDATEPGTQGRGQFQCGATLITKRFVLTAAHCMINGFPVAVRLGEHNITSEVDCRIVDSKTSCQLPYEDIGIEKIIPHEGYSRFTQKNDIALVKLVRDVVFKDHINPICLPLYVELQKSILETKVMRVTGWGRQTAHGNDSDVPMEAGVSRLPLASCTTMQNRSIAKNQICVSASLQDSCKGDSGGPLLFNFWYKKSKQRFVQIGIVSYGPENCGHKELGETGEGQTSVYTDVTRFIPWITRTVAQ
ncbi:serine protease grass-like isoform X2 [Drosophila miranda]|uniref:serine protease grass-like isoform X2 n=1 Tax=Drosophila miranda TaxID=7229 RepID=UPI0007E65A75|nr:serine protease grass-like isoform X2 [Drosophila miranda]